MLKLIINTYGEDKPGLVSDLSGIIHSLNGNILESKMVRLENIFTIIMAIEIPENNKSKLEHKIKSIEGLNSTLDILNKFDINKKSTKFVFSLVLSSNIAKPIVVKAARALGFHIIPDYLTEKIYYNVKV